MTGNAAKQTEISYECVPCDICDNPRPIAGYGTSTCPTCGQEWAYDESETMSLTKEQYDVLREHYQRTRPDAS